ncbi:hypothetical protein MTO96_002302 [Rhipicephalus appendiculatus]
MVAEVLIDLVRLFLHALLVLLVLLITAALIDTRAGYNMCRRLFGAHDGIGRSVRGSSVHSEPPEARRRHSETLCDSTSPWPRRRPEKTTTQPEGVTRSGYSNDAITNQATPRPSSTGVSQMLSAGHNEYCTDGTEKRENCTEQAPPPSSMESDDDRHRNARTTEGEVPIEPPRPAPALPVLDGLPAASRGGVTLQGHPLVLDPIPLVDVKHATASGIEDVVTLSRALSPTPPSAVFFFVKGAQSPLQDYVDASPRVADMAPMVPPMAMSPSRCESATNLPEASISENVCWTTYLPPTPPATPDGEATSGKHANGGNSRTPKCATCGKFFKVGHSGDAERCKSCQPEITLEKETPVTSNSSKPKRTPNCGSCGKFYKVVPSGDPSLCESCQSSGRKESSALFSSPEPRKRTPNCGRCGKFYKVVPSGDPSLCESCPVKWQERIVSVVQQPGTTEAHVELWPLLEVLRSWAIWRPRHVPVLPVK